MLTFEYDKIRDMLDTGDILCCSGRGLASGVIKVGTYGPKPIFPFWRWRSSHTAGIVRWPVLAPPWDNQRVLVYESTTLNPKPDAITGRPISGVQLHPMSEWLRDYPGSVALRRLHVARTPQMLCAVQRHVQRNHGVHYEQNPIEILYSALDFRLMRWADNRPDTSSMFCSELWGDLYNDMGLWNTLLAPNELTPRDWAGENLPLIPYADLGTRKLLHIT